MVRPPSLFAVGIAALFLPQPVHAEARPHRNDLPPRLQWNANKGYCGETSFIVAGLSFGQYVSQFTARVAAIGKTPQNEGELLLGVNDHRAARALRLDLITAPPDSSRDARAFLSWVKRQVLRDRPVIIGVFENKFRFTGTRDPLAGDPDYDHIVPVVGCTSTDPYTPDRAQPTDRIRFSDNGLWGVSANRPYYFRPRVDGFPATRAEANEPKRPIYSLPALRQHGVAIPGVLDRFRDTLPVRIETSVNAELPSMPRGSTRRPPAGAVTLFVTVTGLRPGVTYHLYRYDRLGQIPNARFNARAAAAAERRTFTPKNSRYRFAETILSDEVAAYRCVRATAP